MPDAQGVTIRRSDPPPDFASHAVGLAALVVALHGARFLGSPESLRVGVGVTVDVLLPACLSLAAILAVLGQVAPVASLPGSVQRATPYLALVYVIAPPVRAALATSSHAQGTLLRAGSLVAYAQAAAAFLLAAILAALALLPLVREWRKQPEPSTLTASTPGVAPILFAVSVFFAYDGLVLLRVAPDIVRLGAADGPEEIRRYIHVHGVATLSGATGLLVALLGSFFELARPLRSAAAALFASGLALASVPELATEGSWMMLPWLSAGLLWFIRRLLGWRRERASARPLLPLVVYAVLVLAGGLTWFRVGIAGPAAGVLLAAVTLGRRTQSVPAWCAMTYAVVAALFVLDGGARGLGLAYGILFAKGLLWRWSAPVLWLALLLTLLLMRQALRRGRPSAPSPGAAEA
jgi:hypothetical protein